MIIKICGIRRSEDVGYVNLFLPDYIGFILAPGYRRTVDINDARYLAGKLSSRIKKVGVFVDQPAENAARVASYVGLDVIQLHGSEDNEYIKKLKRLTDLPVWNVFKVKNTEEVKKADESLADMILLDTYSPDTAGGTGKKVNTDIIKDSGIKRDFIIAGGINCENVCSIINEVGPFGVDVSGGTETDGVKDMNKIAGIIKKVREMKSGQQ